MAENSLKYSGIDKPKKRATPVIKRFLIEFMLVNCKNDRPTEAENNRKISLKWRKKQRDGVIKLKVGNVSGGTHTQGQTKHSKQQRK